MENFEKYPKKKGKNMDYFFKSVCMCKGKTITIVSFFSFDFYCTFPLEKQRPSCWYVYRARARGQVRDTYTDDRNWITVRIVRIAAYRHWRRVEGIKEDDGYIRLLASPLTENVQSFATLSTGQKFC
jgi:hypothetical protein